MSFPGFGVRPPRDRPLVLAHRGDSYHAPENTLEAAALGLAAGADAWELDVQVTRDGVPVVLHDDSLVRTTDVSLRFPDDPRAASGYLVSDFDLGEIRPLDAGSWFVDPTGPPRSAAWFGTLGRLTDEERASCASGLVRIPTLEEALDWTRRNGWRVNVELKSVPLTDRRLVATAIGAMKEAGLDGRLLVSCFDHGHLLDARRLWQEVPLGVLTTTPLGMPDRYVREMLGATCYHPSASALGSDSLSYRESRSAAGLRVADLRRLEDAGVPVNVYTVNDARKDGLASRLVAAGVTGLFTDDPRSLVERFRPPARGPSDGRPAR